MFFVSSIKMQNIIKRRIEMICDYGCGQEAEFTLKNKKNCCSKYCMSCPEIRKKNSTGTKKKYDSGERLSGPEQYKTFSDDSKNKMLWSKGKTLLNCADEVFVENSSRSTEYIKKIILREKIMDYQCKECDLTNEWRDKELVLELDHINGIGNDNRLKNLRFLCPNCHSQTENFRGRNTGKRKYISDSELVECLSNEKNIRTALIAIGLSPKGGNYTRATKLIAQYKIQMKGW